MEELTPEQMQKQLVVERNRKTREFAKQMRILGLYQNLITVMASRPQDRPHEESPQELCKRAMELAQWAAAVWLENYPESDEDLLGGPQFANGGMY